MGIFYDLPNSSLFGDDLVACSVRKRMADVHGQIRGCVLLYQLRGLTLALQVIVLEERIGTFDVSKFFPRKRQAPQKSIPSRGFPQENQLRCQLSARLRDQGRGQKWHPHPKIWGKTSIFWAIMACFSHCGTLIWMKIPGW